MEINGDALSIRRGGLPINPENPTFGLGLPSGGYYGLTGETYEIHEPIAPRSQRPRKKRSAASRKAEPSEGPECRSAWRTWWKNAQKAVLNMEQAAGTDLMQVAISANDLDLALAQLWNVRANRDINWQTILNHVQGMLRIAFKEKLIEKLTPDQCCIIRTIVDNHLGTSTKSEDDLSSVVDLIEAAGFDPYAAISADPMDDRIEE